ncbi:MAG: CPBP family intramembrane metalloprotease [Exiguobacterium sp.]|nr:CPBP family intramembrane metalloprotease [Exiguobacterium sp.]MBR3215164.1 CPBP family intramembrane metalloprotease [Exiguobacterium sp.]
METMRTKISGLIIGALLLVVGFIFVNYFAWGWWGLFVGGILAWVIAFKNDSKLALTFPKKLWIIPLGIIIYFVYSFIVSYSVKLIGFEWAANPAVGQLSQIIWILPFMLFGEELLGIGILEGAKSKGLSTLLSSLLSAVVFALLHVPAYWDGSLFSTLLHVLLLQGFARLLLNYVYLKTGRSIWGSWVTHLIIDLIALSVAVQ